MNARQPKGPRGQAIVETALGIVVVGAVLVCAIQFGEMGFVALKMEEAAAAGLWASTSGGRFHHWPRNDPEPFDCTNAACVGPPLVPTAALGVQARYVDFDGREDVNTGASISQMYVNVTGLTVACQVGAAPLNGRGVDQGGNGGLVLDPNFEDNKGISCRSEGTVNAGAFFPGWYFEGNLGGGDAMSIMKLNNVKVCGVGRPSGGNCTGRFEMMLDDWGASAIDESDVCLILANPAAATGCSMPGPRNTRFHEAAKRVYDTVNPPMPGAGSLLAWWVMGWSPISTSYPVQDEGEFFLSAAGEDTLFIQPPPIPWGGLLHYRFTGFGTTPGAVNAAVEYPTSFVTREKCFLGKGCT